MPAFIVRCRRLTVECLCFFYIKVTRVLHGADGGDFVIPACVVLIELQGVTDGIAKIAKGICIASYADAL